jgi:CheY-like chemotaxis protein
MPVAGDPERRLTTSTETRRFRVLGSENGAVARGICGTDLAIAGVMARDSNSDLGSVPVLIIEDEEASAKLIAGTLETHGYDTMIAGTAEEAIALLAPFAPRAIVLDLVLPQMSGLVLAEQLKENPATRDIPIIATSEFSAQDAAQIAREAGCAYYVSKSIDPASFRRLLLDRLKRSK